MNTLEHSFTQRGDGWVHVVPRGEYPHRDSGKVQVIDDRAFEQMMERFLREAARPNFSGLLVDQDHFSYDKSHPSSAYGWAKELDLRSDGLWARIEFTDEGESAVRNRRYKFVSPVFGETENLGNGRLRPVRLETIGFTNAPNMKGMNPIANRGGGHTGSQDGVADPDPRLAEIASATMLLLANRQPGGSFAERWEQACSRYSLLNRTTRGEAIYANRAYDASFTLHPADQAVVAEGAKELRAGYEAKESWGNGARRDLPYFTRPNHLFAYGDKLIADIARNEGISLAAAFDRLEEVHPLLWVNLCLNQRDGDKMVRLAPSF